MVLRNVDETIIRYADSHSPEEISKILGGGISPARIASHTAALLKSKNWLSRAQEEQLILLKMRLTLNELEDQYLDKDNARLRLQYLKEIAERLDKRSEATEEQLNKLYGNQGRIMARAYDIALGYIAGAFREEIDPKVWADVTRDALLHAQTELAKHQAVEE